MGLEKYLTKAIAETRASFSSNKEKWADYLTKYELKEYFEGVSEEQKKKLRGTLEKKLEEAKEKFDSELRGIGRKITSKGSMGAMLGADVLSYFTNVGLNTIGNVMYPLYLVKTLSEIPALYKYFKKTKDWYGALKHMLLKPVRMVLPFLGAAFEAGSFDRMVRKRIIKEAKYSFLKDIGKYIPITEKIKEKLKKPVFEIVSKPVKKAA